MEALGVSSLVGVLSSSPAFLGAATGVTVLCLELPHRITGVRPEEIGIRSYARGVGKIALRCAPELVGLSVCLMFAVALRINGDDGIQPEVDVAVWEEIKREWPILMGADTLLNLQAMLRLFAVLAVSLREEIDGPLSGMAAVLMMASMLARGSLATRTSAYRLEGPLSLGGDLPIACEVAMIPRLAMLSFRAVRNSPVTATAVLSVATWYASHHYLNLAHDPSTDRLFTVAHVFELLASFAFLFNTILAFASAVAEGKTGASIGFMHILMPFQQALAAYYFLVAFTPAAELVGAGRPFCLLCIGNLLQLGLYVGASALYLAKLVEDRCKTNSNPSTAARHEDASSSGNARAELQSMIGFPTEGTQTLAMAQVL